MSEATFALGDRVHHHGPQGSARLHFRRVAVFALLYALSIYLGRLSVQSETGLAFFWPASGVGALWALTSVSRRDLEVCISLVFVISSVGNGVSGMSWGPGLVLGVANVVFTAVPRLLLDRPRIGALREWPSSDRPRLATVSMLGRLMLALAVGAAASGAVGMLGVALSGRDPGWLPWLSWITRNGAAAVVIVLPVLASPAIAGPRPHPGGRGSWSWLWGSRRAELVLLVLATVVVAWWIFGPGTTLPLTFIPFGLVAWAGLRFRAALAGLLGSLLAVLTLVLVLGAEGGAFGSIVDPGQQAFTLQGFMVLTVVLAMLVALVIEERDELASRLAGSERQAREQAADLETITDTMPVGLFVMHQDGSTLRTNPTAHQLLGENQARHLEHPRELGLRRLDGSPVAFADRPTSLALAGQSVRELRLMSDDPVSGGHRVWSFAAAPLLGPDDESPDRALVLFRDVTDEHERTTQLENFAGVVAHDLQNPVTAIQGWADVLSEALEELDPHRRTEAARALGHIQRAAGRGTQLIGDLLDYSVARTSALHPTGVDLDRLVTQLADTVTVADPQRGTTISHRDLGTVVADPVLVRQLLANLIGNAVKYTPTDRPPRIEVGAARQDGWLELTVSDNGVGIPAEQRTRIFEAFHRAHADDPRFSGTGLGLAICLRAVERHGGTLHVEDNPEGAGTRFTVRLPCTP